MSDGGNPIHVKGGGEGGGGGWDNFPKNLSTKPRYCIGFSVVFMT